MNRFFILLFAASCLTAVGQDFDGMTQAFTTDSSLFLTSEDYLSWDSAQAFAASLGGHLATFVSTAENLEVVPSVNSNVGTGGYWFGLRQDVNGTEPNEGWGWATGESLTFTNWSDSEPNNVNGVEDCGELNSNGTWNDADCEVLRRFVVEVTLHAGCADQQACNFDSQANFDDGSCHFNCQFCHDGTVWDEDLFKCIVANPSDSNFDGCVQLNDLLDLLSAYGDCVAEESAWQCGDPLEYQGYDYETVQIGEQCWFAENLRAANYRNGDSIPSSVSNSVWQETDEGSVSVFGESMDCEEWAPFIDACDPSVSLGTYGRLYNWYAVNDDRGLCASGWHVPSDAEWISLELGLGMLPEDSVLTDDYRGMNQGIQMKLYDGWDASETAGTNSSNFSGLPGGYRSVSGLFWDAGRNGYFWSATIQGIDQAYFRNLTYDRAGVYRAATNAEYGFSVRCIKDTE